MERRLTERRGDRRKGKDLLLHILTTLSAATALIIVIALILLSRAKPHAFAGLDPDAFDVRSQWDPTYATYLFYVLVSGFLSSTVGLVINSRRLKRKTDTLRMNLVFLWILTVVGMGSYVYNF